MSNIKKLIAIFFIIILLFSFLVGSLINIVFNNKKSNAAEKINLPKIKLKTLTNKDKNINEISKPTLLLFYLPQSPNCQQQLQILSQIHNQKQELNIIAVAIGDIPIKELKDFKKENMINFDFLIDHKAELTEELKITVIPTLVFYHPTQGLKSKEGLIEEKNLIKLINKNL